MLNYPENAHDWRLSYEKIQTVLDNYGEYSSGLDPDPIYAEYEICQKATNTLAPFVRRCELAAEVALRVKQCGADGLIVAERYGFRGIPVDAVILSREWHMDYDYIVSRIHKVICFCCAKREDRVKGYQWWKSTRRMQASRIQNVASIPNSSLGVL